MLVIWKVHGEIMPTISLRFWFGDASVRSLVSLPYSSEQEIHLRALYLIIYLFKLFQKISLETVCNLLRMFLSVVFCFFPTLLLCFLDTIYHLCLFDFLLHSYSYPTIHPMKSQSELCLQNYYVLLGYSQCSCYLCEIFKDFYQIGCLDCCIFPSPDCNLSFFSLTQDSSVLRRSGYPFNFSLGFCSWPPTDIQVNSCANHRGNRCNKSKKRDS